jgi:hypothetical protein
MDFSTYPINGSLHFVEILYGRLSLKIPIPIYNHTEQ